MRENYVVRAPIQPLRHTKRQAFKIVKTRPFFSLLSPHQSLVLLIKVINRLGSKPFFFPLKAIPESSHHTTATVRVERFNDTGSKYDQSWQVATYKW
jgi:hypothetical protein